MSIHMEYLPLQHLQTQAHRVIDQVSVRNCCKHCHLRQLMSKLHPSPTEVSNMTSRNSLEDPVASFHLFFVG
ncbi:hypothetical protein ABKV19_021341 [Rosa sericea]